MDAKENIIIQLKDIWLKLKLEKENLASRSNSKSLSDEDKQDIKESIECAQDVYDAHLNNIAMNVKNNFYSWKDVDKVDKDLAVEVERVLEEK
jgi:hypothetical protein|tara:strand:- start:28446 stop:28724 length:279 start_codon:yes stop_codon:yes gene_type:complete